MLADSLVLADEIFGSTPSSATFVKVSDDVNGSVRIDGATDLSAPRHLTIRHSSQKAKDGRIVDRHLVQITDQDVDVNGIASVVTVNLTIAMPRQGQTELNAQRALGQLVSVIALSGMASTADKQARLKALLRNER